MDQNKKSQTSPRIAFIKASWHANIVDQCYIHCVKTLEAETKTDGQCQIDVFTVPGALEIPLLAKDIAKTKKYDAIIASAFVVDGGIYHHEYVSATVLDAMMKVSLDEEIPIFSAVLTPHNYQETEVLTKFFYDHFKTKGQEVAQSCLEMLEARQLVFNTQ